MTDQGILTFALAFFFASLIILAGWSIKHSYDYMVNCREAGGIYHRGICLNSSAIVELKQ